VKDGGAVIERTAQKKANVKKYALKRKCEWMVTVRFEQSQCDVVFGVVGIVIERQSY